MLALTLAAHPDYVTLCVGVAVAVCVCVCVEPHMCALTLAVWCLGFRV